MVIGLDGMDGDTFLTKVCQGWRITIPEPVRKKLGLKVGDRLRVTVEKVET